ncbi:MAG: helix-turn-helix domain-containing protein [Chloroflexi bacterium]|nr:helix-turn-helix domain-containing protein [Chloroflexota bacterium]
MLHTARRRSGLTQRQLAQRSGVPQATIARIELGAIQPRTDTLERLLRAAGASLATETRLGEGVDRTQIRERLRMTPAERSHLGVDEAAALRRLTDRTSPG